MLSAWLTGALATSATLDRSFIETQYVVTTRWPSSKPTANVEAQESSSGRKMAMMDASGTSYTCQLPAARQHEPAESSTDILQSAWQLLDTALAQTCIRKRLGWWTYELCHKERLRQFHEVRAGSLNARHACHRDRVM